MKMLNVLREQEEEVPLQDPNDNLYSTEPLKKLYKKLGDLYDRMDADRTYFRYLHHFDELGNRVDSSTVFKNEYDVLEINCTVYYTIVDNNFPEQIDDDIAVKIVKKLTDEFNERYDLSSYDDDILDLIVFSFKDMAFFINSPVVSQILQIPKLLTPIEKKFHDGVPYTSLKTMNGIIARYRIPKAYSIKFVDDFKEKNVKAVKRVSTLLKILKSGSVDGHSYELKSKPLISLSPFKNFKAYQEFSKTEGNKVLPSDFSASVSLYPSLIIIDGVDGEIIKNSNPELYNKVRTHIAKLFNYHRIVDSFSS